MNETCRRAVVAGCAAIFAIYLAVIFATYPTSDDFWFYARYLDNGHSVILAARSHFTEWEHRILSYVFSIIPVVLTSNFSLPIFVSYWLWGILTSLAFPGVFFGVMRLCLPDTGWKRQAQLALVLAVACIATLPFNYESFFWITDKAFWSLPALFTLLFIVGCSQRAARSGLGNRKQLAVLLALIMALGSFNQFVTLAMVIFFTLSIYPAQRAIQTGASARERNFYIFLAGAALAATFIYAVGNARVTANPDQKPSFEPVFILATALRYLACDYLPAIARKLPALLFLGLFLSLCFGKKPAVKINIDCRLWALFCFCMLVAGTMIHVAVTGTPPPPRVMSMMHVFIIFGIFLAALQMPPPNRWAAGGFYLLLIVVAVAAVLHADDMIKNIYGTPAAQWRQAQRTRYDDIQALASPGTCNMHVPPFDRYIELKVVFWFDLGTDPAFWVNQAVAKFYGLKSIVADWQIDQPRCGLPGPTRLP